MEVWRCGRSGGRKEGGGEEGERLERKKIALGHCHDGYARYQEKGKTRMESTLHQAQHSFSRQLSAAITRHNSNGHSTPFKRFLYRDSYVVVPLGTLGFRSR